MELTALDGRAYAKFMVAGAYFLRKYRGVLNDLNVFPVPDGDTGTNMYLTARQAALQAGKVRGPLSAVAEAAAEGSLMGARGNSGVIISQMLRGFAHHVRHRDSIDTFVLATGLRESVAAARQALVKPQEGTILSVADAAADAAYHLALHEDDFYRLCNGVLRAANDALDRTPEQLSVLKEAGVVDSGGAGFVYFLEGALRFLPKQTVRATAFPRRPERKHVFTSQQRVAENRFCTEFVLEKATIAPAALRDLLLARGDSLIVAGDLPTVRVHLHTDDPNAVQALAAKHGVLTRVKVDDMEQQHNVLVIDRPPAPYAVVALVPGPGFARIARELGAEEAPVFDGNPSVRELLLALNKTLADDVYLLVNNADAVLAAQELPRLTDRRVHVLPTRDVVGGIAALFALRSVPRGEAPSPRAVMEAAARVRSARVFFAGKGVTLGGTSVRRGNPAAESAGALYAGETLAGAAQAALEAMEATRGGLITIYYGGSQKEHDAQRVASDLRGAFPATEVEYYYGGARNVEYWVSLDE